MPTDAVTVEDAYRRFPILPLTEEWALAARHVDFFRSDDPVYAFTRMARAMWASNTPYNCAVWVPETPIAQGLETSHLEWSMSEDYHPPCWQRSSTFDDVLPPRMGDMDKIRLAARLRDRVEKLREAFGNPSGATCISHRSAYEHFALKDGAGLHVDGEIDDHDKLRFVEIIFGNGTAIVPNANVIFNQARSLPSWKRPDAEIISPIMEVPSGAVVAVANRSHPLPLAHAFGMRRSDQLSKAGMPMRLTATYDYVPGDAVRNALRQPL